MSVSLSYFFYDLLCCSLEVPFDVAMAFHHVFTILGLSYGIISGHVSSAAHRFKNKATSDHECEKAFYSHVYKYSSNALDDMRDCERVSDTLLF